MRHLVATVSIALLAGCFTPTFAKLQPGRPPGQGTIVLVGSFTADPPIEQHEVPRDCSGVWVQGLNRPGKVIFVQETDGNVMAFFTRDPSAPFDAATFTVPPSYDWTYMPLSGPFFVEVPASTRRVNLRGFTYLTNAGSRMFDLPAVVDLSPRDRIVYVGEIRVRRGPGRRAEFVNAMDGARRAARERGHTAIAGAPWTVRLLHTPAGKPSVSAEFGESCSGKGSWKKQL